MTSPRSGAKIAPYAISEACGCGGIGRLIGFRFQRASVQVRVLSSAPRKARPHGGLAFLNAATWTRTHLNATVRWTVAGWRGGIRRDGKTYSLIIGYNSVTMHPVLARRILKRRSARCFSSLATPVVTPTATPSGRFSAGSAALAAN